MKAIWGLPGYTFMGIHKEVRKLFGSSVLNYVISARTAQGYEDWKTSTAEERADIVTRWHHEKNLQGAKQRAASSEDGYTSDQPVPSGFKHTRHLSFDERKKLKAERAKQLAAAKGKDRVHSETSAPSTPSVPSHHLPSIAAVDTNASELSSSVVLDNTLDFEQAIKASVAATSRGDPDEDFMIERAIRASVSELHRAQQGPALSDEETLERAIKASVVEASARHPPDEEEGHEIQMIDSENSEHRAIVERSLQESLRSLNPRLPSNPPVHEDVDSDDDENMRAAIVASRVAHEEAQRREKTEDEILLKAVEKQSLLEAEYRQKLQRQSGSGSTSKTDGVDDEDEQLKKAIEESLRG